MAKPVLSAAERSSLIRLAGSMPVGSAERKAILGGLKKTGSSHYWDVTHALQNVQKRVRSHLDHYINESDQPRKLVAAGKAVHVLTGHSSSADRQRAGQWLYENDTNSSRYWTKRRVKGLLQELTSGEIEEIEMYAGQDGGSQIRFWTDIGGPYTSGDYEASTRRAHTKTASRTAGTRVDDWVVTQEFRKGGLYEGVAKQDRNKKWDAENETYNRYDVSISGIYTLEPDSPDKPELYIMVTHTEENTFRPREMGEPYTKHKRLLLKPDMSLAKMIRKVYTTTRRMHPFYGAMDTIPEKVLQQMFQGVSRTASTPQRTWRRIDALLIRALWEKNRPLEAMQALRDLLPTVRRDRTLTNLLLKVSEAMLDIKTQDDQNRKNREVGQALRNLSKALA
jgi:hypothetical protein